MYSSLADLLTIGLAGYQLTRFLTIEKGPFGIFEKYRELGSRYTSLVECPYCTGFWMIGITFLGYQTPVQWFFLLMAGVGIHSLLQDVSQKLRMFSEAPAPRITNNYYAPSEAKRG